MPFSKVTDPVGICEGEFQMIPHLLDWKLPAW